MAGVSILEWICLHREKHQRQMKQGWEQVGEGCMLINVSSKNAYAYFSLCKLLVNVFKITEM
jgi:hypothetical protein